MRPYVKEKVASRINAWRFELIPRSRLREELFPRPRVRHSRMLLSGSQARSELHLPTRTFGRDALEINSNRCLLIPRKLAAGSSFTFCLF
jgi:hypothetical protein